MTQNKYHDLNSIDLRYIANILLENKKLIILMSLIISLLSTSCFLLKPIYYQSKIILKIQNTHPTTLGSIRNNNTESSSMSYPEEPVSVQIALLRSDFILKSVIDSLGLNITIKPLKKFYLMSNHGKIHIQKLTVPANLLNQKMELRIVNNNIYRLYNPNGDLLLEANKDDIKQNAAPVSLALSEMNGMPGSRFLLIKHSDTAILNQIRSNLTITNLSNMAENSEHNVAIVQLALTGKNPKYIAETLNKIALISQEKNIILKSMEAEKTLAFLNQELPILRDSLQAAEEKLNAYRATNGRVNIELQTQYLLTHLSDIDKALDALRLKSANLLQQYTMYHPVMVSLHNEKMELEKQRQTLLNQLRQLPAADQEDINLTRDVKIKNNLYIQLLNQIHQSQVIKAGIVSDVQILSPATTPEIIPAIKPSLMLMISLFCGMAISCMLVLVWRLVKAPAAI